MTENLLEDAGNIPEDQITSYRDLLVGDGRKYKDDEAVAKAAYHANLTVKDREAELARLREDFLAQREVLQTQASLKELTDQISALRNVNSDATNNANTGTHQQAINPDDIKNLLSSELQRYENSKKEQGNLNEVKEKLTERFGVNYQGPVKEQIQSLGMTDEAFNDMAKSNPKVLFRILGIDSSPRQEGFQAPPRTQQRQDSFNPKGVNKRDWSYYEELRKKSPEQYHTKQTQMQMIEDRKALGEAFMTGRYSKVKYY